MSAPPDTPAPLHTFPTNLAQFAQKVEQLNQGNAQAVRDLSRTVTELATSTASSIDRTHEQLGAVATALATTTHAAPAQDLAPLLRQLAAQQAHSALKLDPPTYNGRTDFREWKRKLELIYEAKQLSDAQKLTWTLALLQDGASRVATQAAPNTYAS